MPSFRDRLARSKVVQWALAYLAAAWVVLQVVDVVGGHWGWPAVVVQVLTVLLGVGFLAALVLAWYHGEKGAQRVTGPELVMLAVLFVIAGTLIALLTGRGAAGDDGVAAGTVSEADRPGAMASYGIPSSLGASEFVASVAVLPFDNMGADSDELLAEGVTEEIIAQLAQVRGLKVISRTSVVALKESALTLPQIADTLGVNHVLEGSVRRSGQQGRITVQLIEAATDAHVWAHSYDRAVDDLFAVQREIASAVTRALVEQVPRLRPSSASDRGTASPAYQTYLRGRQLLHRRTRESLLGAMATFEEAARLDPDFAPTFAAHAATLALWPHYGYPGGPDPYTAHARAIALADSALALNPDLADALAARGLALTHAWAPPREVASDFVRAVEIQPNSADIHGWYAHLLTRAADFDAALGEAQRAIDLDPIAPGRRVGFAIDALGARRYDLVLREARAALAIEPSLAIPRAWEGLALLLLGQPDRCLELGLEAFAGIRAMCLHAAGRTTEAERMIRASIEDFGDGAGTETVDAATIAEDVATYFAWTGDRDRAFRWLERAFEQSPDGVDFRYVQSGLFDRIRGDPAFQRRFEALRTAGWERVEEMSRGR